MRESMGRVGAALMVVKVNVNRIKTLHKGRREVVDSFILTLRGYNFNIQKCKPKEKSGPLVLAIGLGSPHSRFSRDSLSSRG
jgi:hypothetical protein